MNKIGAVACGLGLLLSCAVTGCSGGGSAGNSVVKPAEKDKEEAAIVNANDPAELVIFGQVGNTEQVWNERFGAALKQRFPNYTFKYIQRNSQNTIQNMIASGQTIDLIHDSIGGINADIVNTGYGYDLAEMIKKHQVDLNRLEPSVLQSVSVQGKLYGLPLHDGGLVLYYNKDIFDKFGVPYPKNGMTWDEAIELGKKLTRFDGRQYVGLGISVDHMLMMNPYSLPFVNETTGKAALNNEAYRKLVSKSIIDPISGEGYQQHLATLKRTLNNDDFMKEKNVAMFVMNFYLQLQPDFDTFNWDMVSLPVFPDLPGVGTQPYPNGLFLTNISKYKDQAMEVLKYTVSDEFQTMLSRKGFVPVVKSEAVRSVFAKDTAFKDKQLIPAMFTNKPARPIYHSDMEGLVTAPLKSNLMKVMTGETDLNTALRDAEEQANKAMEAVKK
ncbi:extracellular solute-binding protein [Paenibacillus sp. H1-7]|uniref:ABC transporter substrate-binding protein n=1 Tax=Paenibacillus sp. H1-7 TaxID=2282849 RepID=UPI001EF9305A|nr:extracellular solute-binding protein [Paenibacillus sp. H1-7]ULL16629.1 extracellular solute-binding protein [Paenibacillus sp. H1-7]